MARFNGRDFECPAPLGRRSSSAKQKVIVLAVTVQGLSVTETARRYGVSRRWVHELLNRHRDGGLESLEPRSAARTAVHAAPVPTARILALRVSLTEAGLDAGPITIAWHLEQGLHPPSSSTVRRILHAAGLIHPEPKKRPKTSLHRFEAHQPNETWQSASGAEGLGVGCGCFITMRGSTALIWHDNHHERATFPSTPPGYPMTRVCKSPASRLGIRRRPE